MESCPHCNFLVRDGARTCGVCHKSVVVDASAGTFRGFDVSEVDMAHIGPGQASGTPIAVVVMLMLVVLLGAGAGVVAVTGI